MDEIWAKNSCSLVIYRKIIHCLGGNGANGVFNNYPDSVVPEEESAPSSENNQLIHEIDEELSAAMQSGNAPEINPYPTPPNPCPLPYPDENGKIKPYTGSYPSAAFL